MVSGVHGRVSRVFNHAGRALLEGSNSTAGLHDIGGNSSVDRFGYKDPGSSDQRHTSLT